MKAFTRLVSNVKGDVNIELRPYTAVTGVNRAGKSSLLDTIRLAITGKHPVGPHPGDLVELAPEEADRLYAELHGPDGSLCWDMQIVDGKPKRSPGVIGHGAFQQFSAADRQSMLVLDNLSGLMQDSRKMVGAERMRRAIMQRFGVVDAVTPPAGLNDAQLNMWQSAQIAAKGDAAEQLTHMQKWFKSTAKSKGDEAKSKSKTIETLRGHVADVGGQDVVDLVQAQLARAQQHELAQAQRSHVENLQQQLEGVNAAIGELEAHDVSADKKALELLRKDKHEAQTALTNAQNLRTLVERADGSTCPLCHTEDVDLVALRTALDDGITLRQQQVMETSKAITDIEQRLPTNELARLRTRQRELETQLKDAAVGLPEPYQGPSATELQRQLNMIREAQATKKRIELEDEAMHRLLDEQATAKLLEKQATNMLNDCLREVRVRAQTAVNRFMPSSFQAKLKITDSVCEWRMIGADKRSHKHGAYSGSEGGSLLISLAQAWVEDSPFRLVLIDDVDLGVFDRERLTDVFAKFRESVEEDRIDQVILVWNRPDEVPADWHTVTLGD